jgi:nucleoside-triphosphatase THEP1
MIGKLEVETRPHSYHPVKGESGMRLVLLVAPSGVGKTTACLKVVEMAQNTGLRVAGILSVPIYQGEVKVGIALRDLATGQERLLARAHQPGAGPQVGIWKFDPENLAWGQQVLATLPASDLLVIDEIGPLEIEMRQGLTNALDALRGSSCRLGLVSLRPSLVEVFTEQFDGQKLSIRQLDERNRDSEPQQIIAEVLNRA